MDGTIEDALLVPVSVNYEKLVDGNFVREQLGQPKQMETFWKAIKSIWSILNSNYGMMRIDFNQPFSLQVSILEHADVSRCLPALQTEVTHWIRSW
jgi:glycerol-3-phosphate O-acyltransferase 1/2